MVGYWGPITFDASHLLAQDISRSGGKNSAQYQLISGKPRTQYIGPTLRQISVSAYLCAACGVKPRDVLEQLGALAEGNEAYYLVIGGRVMAQRPVTLKTVSEAWGVVYHHGELFSATVDLSFEEYL